MLKSMTGYGRGEFTLHNRKFVVEIKSVNHRYNDITIKLPRVLNPFEEKIRKQVSKFASRGKIDVYIQMETQSSDDIKIKLNRPLADAYVDRMRELNEIYQLNDKITIATILGCPDIIEVEKNIIDDEALLQIWECAEPALKNALSNFVAMREAEGESLKNDILVKNEVIKELTQKVSERAPSVVADYRARLRAKLEEVLENTSIDENKILAEAVVFADRTCVDEELTRLSSHLKQLDDILNENDAIGRKLDFLVQEMNREVNTIGSKSNDIEITQLVVSLKSEVEKIREQVQNIE